jgi:hypothetical protein
MITLIQSSRKEAQDAPETQISHNAPKNEQEEKKEKEKLQKASNSWCIIYGPPRHGCTNIRVSSTLGIALYRVISRNPEHLIKDQTKERFTAKKVFAGKQQS